MAHLIPAKAPDGRVAGSAPHSASYCAAVMAFSSSKLTSVALSAPSIFAATAAMATRYDKLALTYRSAAVLHAVFIWSAALGDTP